MIIIKDVNVVRNFPCFLRFLNYLIYIASYKVPQRFENNVNFSFIIYVHSCPISSNVKFKFLFLTNILVNELRFASVRVREIRSKRLKIFN